MMVMVMDGDGGDQNMIFKCSNLKMKKEKKTKWTQDKGIFNRAVIKHRFNKNKAKYYN